MFFPRFTAYPSSSRSLNGNVTGVLSTRYSEVKGVWDVSYEVPENGIIDNVNVSLIEPVAGGKPAEAVSTTNHVTVTETDWKSNNIDLSLNDVFKAGQTYSVHVIAKVDD